VGVFSGCFSETVLVSAVLGDDLDDDYDAPPGSARRCLKRLWYGLPRIEQIAVNEMRIKDLEVECLHLREEMLELGNRKLYTPAAAKKRQLLLRKDEVRHPVAFSGVLQ